MYRFFSSDGLIEKYTKINGVKKVIGVRCYCWKTNIMFSSDKNPEIYDYKLVRVVKIPQWYGIHDAIYFYEKITK